MRGCAFGKPACSICAGRSRVCGKSPLRKKMRKAIENIRRKIQRLADLARGAASAISDDVRGHGRAVFAVTPVNFLDDALAPIAARQIEIDVGPAFPAFAQETFEDQIDC